MDSGFNLENFPSLSSSDKNVDYCKKEDRFDDVRNSDSRSTIDGLPSGKPPTSWGRNNRSSISGDGEKDFNVLQFNVICFLHTLESYALKNNCEFHPLVADAKIKVSLLYFEGINPVGLPHKKEVPSNMKYFLKEVISVMSKLLFEVRCINKIDSPKYWREDRFINDFSRLWQSFLWSYYDLL